jgi:hypothetical protein
VAVFSQADLAAGRLKPGAPREDPKPAEEAAAPPEPGPEAPRKPKASDPWFTFQHPDATDSSPIDATIEVEGEKVRIERSRVETQNPAVKDYLLKRGWRWMNEEFKQ